MREDDLSDEAKAVLLIVREEAKAGKLTQKQEELLNKAVVLSEAVGIAGRGIIWFAGLAAAVAAIWNYFPKRGI